jgi:hypothetical protein
MSEKMTKETFESALRKQHGQVPMARIPMRSGGTAYVRRPTVDEYEAMQTSLDGAEGAAKQRAYADYVKSCFVGAISAEGEELSFSEVESREGPAFVRGGALGIAVNVLAGSGAPQATYF